MLTLYLLTNKINGKEYVGQTLQAWHDRWAQHRYDAKVHRYASRLHNAILKYGADSFSCTILGTVENQEIADTLEKLFIRSLNTSDRYHGYNIAQGGGGRQAKMRPEAVAKMAVTKIGNRYCVGRVMSPETRAKISASLHKFYGERN